MLDNLNPFIFTSVIALIIVFVIIGSRFSQYLAKARLKKFYERLSLEGYVDLSMDKGVKKDLADEIIKLGNAIVMNDSRPSIANVIIKSEGRRDLFLVDIESFFAQGPASSGNSTSASSVLIKLPVFIETAYVIRQKLHSLAEKMIASMMPQEISIPVESPDFGEKFISYMRKKAEEANIIKKDIQSYIAGQVGTYPFERNSMGIIIISGNYMSVSSSRTADEKKLRELIRFGEGLYDYLIKAAGTDVPVALQEGEKVCPHCGAGLSLNNEFCTECGKVL